MIRQRSEEEEEEEEEEEFTADNEVRCLTAHPSVRRLGNDG